jgi:hypothetical protein
MDFAYRIDDVAVVSDVIGGEAVILHRVSGDYFSTDGVGCLIWQWLGENRSCGWILKTLNERFAAHPTQIEAAVDTFLRDLLAHKLVQEIGEDAKTQDEAPIEPQGESQATFAQPVLHVYSDIRRMILLDPIHEVAQEGWPEPKPIDGPA